MALQRNLERRLIDVRAEIAALRQSLRVLDEQVAYQMSEADDAETRALVSSTPLADRERREAVDHAARARRQRDAAGGRLAELEREQDRLLEQMFSQTQGGG